MEAREIVAGLTKAQRQMLPTIIVRDFPPFGRGVFWSTGSRATMKRLEAMGLVDRSGLTPLGKSVASLLEPAP